MLSGIVGRSPAILKVYDDIRRAAPVDASVLILGESGAGKEVVASAIHENSGRQGKSFVAINCGAIPRELMEAELFGHERGAFTGAQFSKEGLLQVADGGTLFLDEIGDLGPPLQAKLLRALEEGAVRRLGGREPIPFNVRFMASTNRDLHEEVRKKRFRQDLFFRLKVLEIHVPPLRQRREDIPLLAAHFLERYGARYGRRIDGMTREVVELLTGYEWPGNVRELKNVVERAVAYAQGPFITLEELPEVVVRGARRQEGSTLHAWKHMTLERLEKEFLEKALAEHSGNVTHTAQALGIHRSTLQRLMRKWNLSTQAEAPRGRATRETAPDTPSA
jgi:transcriptional regulator with PAS, ATPase and Fis domain